MSSVFKVLPFEALLGVSLPGKRGRVGPHATVTGQAQTRDQVLGRIARNVRGVPQVMVKITSRGYSSSKAQAHAAYLTDHGQLPGEDEQGFDLPNSKSIRAKLEGWRLSKEIIFLDRKVHLPDDQRKKQRQTHHVVLGMPPGTDPTKLMDAARRFARIEFRAHEYVLVLHEPVTDTRRRGKDGNAPPPKHPHVHFVVRSMGDDGRHLRTFKDDMRRWRETFAEQLREVGVPANASSKLERGRLAKRGRSKSLEERVGVAPSSAESSTEWRTPSASLALARHDYQMVIDSLATSVPKSTFVRALQQYVDQTFPPSATRRVAPVERAVQPTTLDINPGRTRPKDERTR
jgi:hypothetical protein